MTTTKTKLAVWQRAAIRAEEEASKGKTWTYGRKQDATAVWAAGPGMPTYTQYAEAGAVALVIVEWRRPEGFSDDDTSKGGYYLHPGNGVRVSAHASVHRAADGALTLGRWIDEDSKPRELSPNIRAIVETVRDW